MRSRLITLGVVTSLLAGGLALAGPGRATRHADARSDRFERLARRLDLTDGQQARMKEIFEQHRAAGLGDAAQRSRESRRDLRRLIHDPAAGEADIRDAAQRSAQADADLAVERHRAFAEAFEVLTPEQRERMKELRRY